MKPEQEKILIKMWLSDKTGSQIAQCLNTTRNAVMGKLKRLRDKGLIEYKTAQAATVGKQASKSVVYQPIKNRRILREIKMGKREAPQIVVAPKKKSGLTPPVRFFDLSSMSCKFPVNDGMPRDFLFCNASRRANSSYCERHHKICYVIGTSEYARIQKRKRKIFQYDSSTQPTHTDQDA